MQEQGVQSKVDVTDKLTAVFKLQSELEAVREQAAERETELRDEVQQARRDRKEMEAKLAGLDLAKMEVLCLFLETMTACIPRKGHPHIKLCSLKSSFAVTM